MKGLSVGWQKLVLWLTGYLNIVAFVIAGGYLYQKSEREEVRYTAKTVLVLTVFFTAVDIVFLLVRQLLTLSNAAFGGYNTADAVFTILKIVCFVAMCILDLFGIQFGKKGKESGEENAEQNAEQNEVK